VRDDGEWQFYLPAEQKAVCASRIGQPPQQNVSERCVGMVGAALPFRPPSCGTRRFDRRFSRARPERRRASHDATRGSPVPGVVILDSHADVPSSRSRDMARRLVQAGCATLIVTRSPFRRGSLATATSHRREALGSGYAHQLRYSRRFTSAFFPKKNITYFMRAAFVLRALTPRWFLRAHKSKPQPEI
jgi:hypothetical protein